MRKRTCRLRWIRDGLRSRTRESGQVPALKVRLVHKDSSHGYRILPAGNSDGETFEEMLERESYNTDYCGN